MANPMTKVAQFNESLDGFSVTGPEQYSTGLLLEAADTNLATNPTGGASNSGWTAGANRTVTRVTSLPGPLPGALASKVTTGFLCAATADFASGADVAFLNLTAPGPGIYYIAPYVWLPSAWTGGQLQVQALDFVGSSNGAANVDMGIRDTWQRAAVTPTLVGGDLAGRVGVRCTASPGYKNGESLSIAALLVKAGAEAHNYWDGSFGTGYAFTSTAHLSTSTRAASSAAISPSGILAPGSGAIAFRVTPTIETGVEEIWGECGVKGAGTDHLRWGRDSTKHPFVEWSSNDAAYERLRATETADAGTAYDLYLGYDGTDVSLCVDAGAANTGSRAAVSDSFGAGDLTLEASAGGVIYNQFATFNRTLTAKEIATLNGKNNWTMNVLTGNPYINFQLRPY